MPKLNLARWLPRSAVNGPGERAVLWVQGCPLACPGCWNPDTWGFERRALHEVEALAASILSTPDLEGVTFTGGEPFSQARSLAALAARLKPAGLSVFIFTGYTLAELTEPAQRALLAYADVLVAGRFVQAQATVGAGWRGSSDQTIHLLSDRYGPEDIAEGEALELHIDAKGGLTLTGFPGPSWRELA